MKFWQRKGLPVVALLAAALLVFAGCAKDDGAPDAGQPAQTDPSGNGAGGENDGDQGAAQDPGEEDLSPVPSEPANGVEKTVVLYFSDDELMEMYRVEREIQAESEADLPKQALEVWMKGPQLAGLTNLMPPDVVVEKVEFRDGVAYVSFSEEIRNANLGSGGEMFLVEQIALIMQQFGYPSTQILVNGKAEESILGHVSTNEPIEAPNPEQYPWLNKS